MNRHGFANLPIIIIALAVIAAVGGYLIVMNRRLVPPWPPQAQTPTSTVSGVDISDWQTYRNAQYGFEVKYPSYYDVIYESSSTLIFDSFRNDFSVGFAESVAGRKFGLLPHIYINVLKNTLAVKLILKSRYPNMTETPFSAGNNIFTFLNLGPFPTIASNIYLIEYGGFTYLITTDLPPESNEKKEILSTFKFISPQGRVDVSTNLIELTYPTPTSILPVDGFVISGRAKEGWTVFEGVVGEAILKDDFGREMGRVQLRATSDWTKPPVSFSGQMQYSAFRVNRGTLLLVSDNPSGIPGREKTYAIPVQFFMGVEEGL